MNHIFLWLHNNKFRAVCFLIGWTALIFYLCLKPMTGMPKIKIPHLDKLVHVILFGGFNYLYLNYLRFIDKRILKVSFILTGAFGLLIEILQRSGIFGLRSFEWMDVVADTLGGVLAGLVFYKFYKKYYQLAKR